MTRIFSLLGASDLESGVVQRELKSLRSNLAGLAMNESTCEVTLFSAEPFSGTLIAPSGPLKNHSGFAVLEIDSDEDSIHQILVEQCRTPAWSSATILNPHIHEPVGAKMTPNPVVRFGFVTRQPHLSPDEFRRHWLNVHAPLVMANEPLFFRYVINIADGSEDWDGLVEQWFADEETWKEHDRRIIEERPEVRADIPNFAFRLDQYVGRPVFRMIL